MKKVFKQLVTLSILMTLCLYFNASIVSADSSQTTIEYLEDGSFYETVISTVPSYNSVSLFSSTTTVTKSKTVYYKNSSGKVLWYVKVTGKFAYGDGSAKCLSCTPSAASNISSWKVSNISGSKKKNTATAKATGKHYLSGTLVSSEEKIVTLTCSSTGTFS